MATKKSEKNTISPMMAHRNELKEKYPDTILLYRLGDFYEMFFEDAIKASKLLDLTLTGRDCGLEERAPMCGVPYHAVDTYIARLVAAGEKVAICEQLTAPGDQKGLLQRDVIRVITPGTNTIEEMLDGTVNHYLVAVAKYKTDYAVSALDIVTGEFLVKYFPDTTLAGCEDYLLGCAPSEIIAPMDVCVESRSLLSVSTERLVKFTTYYDYSFDYDNGKSALLKHYSVFGLEALGLEDNKAVVGALGGLLDYVRSTQKRFLCHLSVPKVVSASNEMYLDYNTRRNLELTETLSDGKKNGSLLWVLDRTKTGMGARMLHQWLLHPLHSVTEIEKRQAGVAELVKSGLTRSALGQALEPVRDLERLVTKISYGSIMPKDCNSLKESLRQLPLVKKVMDKLHSEYFTELNAEYYDFSELVTLLEKTIASSDLPATLKDGGFIAKGCNAELDHLRSIGADSTKTIAEFQERQRELTGVPSLKVGNNRVFGYYIEISNAKRPEVLPSDYVRRQTIANGERYVNNELLNLEKDIFTATERSIQLENEIYADLVRYLNEYVGRLKSIAAFIAKADCIYSLSLVAAENKYVRPKVSQGGTLLIVDGRHPVVEKLLKRNEFVPNDTALDKSNPIAILTGPNMAGKSTYIRQVALITLMAHIGSFVPASKAEIGLCDRIFTRVGASDNLIRGQSTFMVEMLEVANILNNATPDSLLVLDEIGRGTSTLDGVSIAWAIVEHILTKIKAKTLFATHYHELIELEKLLVGIKNYRVLVQESASGISFLYKIARGGANRSFGIEVAGIAGVPASVVARAKDILLSLSETHELSGKLENKLGEGKVSTALPCDQLSLFPEDEEVTEIKKILKETDINRCTPMEALTILADMKKILENKKGK